MFETRQSRRSGGKSLVGFWATSAERAKVRELANAAGFDTVADYLRHLLADDMKRQEKGE